MSLPHFLIIGAQKSGTTTLYRDLKIQPGTFLPETKEPNDLAADRVLTPAGRRQYEGLFRRASAGDVLGEASTAYAKLPDVPRVPERALAVLGPGTRLVYIVRNPIERIVSHYHHEVNLGTTPDGDLDGAVRRDHRFVAYSSYAMQAEPWIDTFGRDSLLVLRFEDYVADRIGTLGAVLRHIGVAGPVAPVDEEKSFKKGEDAPILRGPLARVAESAAYRRAIRPLLSTELRERIRNAVLPRTPARREAPTQATVAYLLEQLRPDLDRQRRVLGGPLWTDAELESVAAIP